jgi:hypothetical protein
MRSLTLLALSTVLLACACGETKVYPATEQGDSSDTASDTSTTSDMAADMAVEDLGPPDGAPDAGETEPDEVTVSDAVESCVPVTCEILAFNCGAIDDQCGNTVSCGLCAPPNTCGSGGNTQVCGCSPDCENKTCGDDGCGGLCGACEDPTPNCSGEGTCEEAPCESDCDGPRRLRRDLRLLRGGLRVR